MITKQVALYARVSSEQQAEAKTIESQLVDLRERIAADGFVLPPSSNLSMMATAAPP